MSHISLNSYNVYGFYDMIFEKTGKSLCKDYIESNYELVNLFAHKVIDGVNVKPIIGIYSHILNDGTNIKLTYSEDSYKELLDIIEKYEEHCLKILGEKVEIKLFYSSAICGEFKVSDSYTFTE